jgi:hypothetical protein
VNWQILCAVRRFSELQFEERLRWIVIVLMSRTISLKWLSVLCRQWDLGVKSVKTGSRFWSSLSKNIMQLMTIGMNWISRLADQSWSVQSYWENHWYKLYFANTDNWIIRDIQLMSVFFLFLIESLSHSELFRKKSVGGCKNVVSSTLPRHIAQIAQSPW